MALKEIGLSFPKTESGATQLAMKIFKKSGADMLKQRFIAKLRKLALCFVVFCFFFKKTWKIIAWKEITTLFCVCIQLHAKASQMYFVNIFPKLT